MVVVVVARDDKSIAGVENVQCQRLCFETMEAGAALGFQGRRRVRSRHAWWGACVVSHRQQRRRAPSSVIIVETNHSDHTILWTSITCAPCIQSMQPMLWPGAKNFFCRH